MSEDWKNDRAEASIHEYEQKKLAEAKEAYKKEMAGKTDEITITLTGEDKEVVFPSLFADIVKLQHKHSTEKATIIINVKNNK